ncbi:MAG: hypothetical protein IJS24_02460, partial [Eubacterium sp.]|nr:hypothetical protein [Eubacterium sp.]
MNKFTRKIVGMITVMAVAIAGVVMPDMWILPGSGSPEVAKAAVTVVDEWGELKTALAGGGDIKLTDNVIADSNSQRLEVPSGKNVTLDLNGHTIDRSFTSASSATANGYVIIVNGSLTLNDTSVSQTGVITGGHTNTGGGVYVSSGGSFTMTGGTISNNTADRNGGGVYVYHGNFTMTGDSTISKNEAGSFAGVFVEEGSFIMKGGTITENKATNYGGGAYVKNGTFIMDDGTISNNEAYQYGGGVYVYGSASTPSVFTMNGGTISENKATNSDGGGVYVSQTRFTMNGGTIKDNSAKSC